MDHINLLGSEEVRQAGYNMQGAAEQMNRTVQNLEHVLIIFTRDLERLVERLEELKEDDLASITDWKTSFIPTIEPDEIPAYEDLDAWDVIIGRAQGQAVAVGKKLFLRGRFESRPDFVQRIIKGEHQVNIMMKRDGE